MTRKLLGGGNLGMELDTANSLLKLLVQRASSSSWKQTTRIKYGPVAGVSTSGLFVRVEHDLFV